MSLSNVRFHPVLLFSIALVSVFFFIEFIFPNFVLTRFASITFFIIILYFCIKRECNFIFLILPIIFHLTVLISLLVLESGEFYAPEINEFSGPNGSTVVHVFYMTYFFLSCYIFLKIFKNKKYIIKKNYGVFKYFYIVLFLFLLVFSLYGLFFGFPFIGLQNRFNYWLDAPYSWILTKLMALMSYFGIILGFLFGISSNKNRRKILLLSFTLFLIVILYSNKFSWFFIFSICFFSGFIFSRNYFLDFYQIINYKKVISYFFILGFFLFFLVYVSYLYIHNYSNHEVIYMIFRRIFVMQGQLSWIFGSLDNDLTSSGNFSMLFFSQNENLPSGIFQLMEKVMPNKLFNGYYAYKVPLTGGFPYTLIFNIGYFWTFIFMIIMGAGFAYLITLINSSLINGQIISVLLVAIYASFHWILTMGSVDILFNKLFLGMLLVSFGYYFFVRLKKNFYLYE